jgi:hypothetical protein
MPHPQFGYTTPLRLSAALGLAVAAVFAVGMGAIFHFIQTDNTTWALTWWWLVAAGVPAAAWIAIRLLRAWYRGALIATADIVQPIALAILVAVIAAEIAWWFYAPAS